MGGEREGSERRSMLESPRRDAVKPEEGKTISVTAQSCLPNGFGTPTYLGFYLRMDVERCPFHHHGRDPIPMEYMTQLSVAFPPFGTSPRHPPQLRLSECHADVIVSLLCTWKFHSLL